MQSKKIIKFITHNYLVVLLIGIVFIVCIISIKKLFFSKLSYVYVRVKVSQGLWWAQTAKPNIWLISNIKKGLVQRDLLGNPIATILQVKNYPVSSNNQYDAFIDLKLKVNANNNTKEYSFNRTSIGVGSPIDLEFPSLQISGTITDISTTPVTEEYIEKIIYLTKNYAYPWEYDAIKIGDIYSDGQNIVFKILDKSESMNDQVVSVVEAFDFAPSLINSQHESRVNITVKAEVKVVKERDKLVFGEEKLLEVGKPFYISIPSYSFLDYTISKVE